MTSNRSLVDRLATRLAADINEPISRQIADDVWLAVVQGALETGARLPTARELAIELGVSPRSVERAYGELEERGVVATRQGQGTFISLHPPSEAELERHQRFDALCRETFDRARALGYSVDDLIDAFIEFRPVERGEPE